MAFPGRGTTIACSEGNECLLSLDPKYFRRKMMKKHLSTLLLLTMVIATLPIFSGLATAQRRDRCETNNGRTSRGYNGESRRYYDGTTYYNDDSYDQDYGYGRRSMYDRHRKAINLGVSTGAGAIIGALIGGRRGALIGAAAGVAGGAIVTAKQRPRNNGRYQY
jgi:hypothetical protein